MYAVSIKKFKNTTLELSGLCVHYAIYEQLVLSNIL